MSRDWTFSAQSYDQQQPEEREREEERGRERGENNGMCFVVDVIALYSARMAREIIELRDCVIDDK